MRSKAQPKDGHPMQAEWDAIDEYARQEGRVHRDGTPADPPIEGDATIPSGQRHSALFRLMKSLEECVAGDLQGQAQELAPRYGHITLFCGEHGPELMHVRHFVDSCEV